MCNHSVYSQFTQAAIVYHLSGRQMQLWMSLYEIITTDHCQDIVLHTPTLLSRLQSSRRQFLRVRTALVEAGFLAIRRTENQKIYYTLLLNNQQVAVASVADGEELSAQEEMISMAECSAQPATELIQAEHMADHSSCNNSVGQKKQPEQNKSMAATLQQPVKEIQTPTAFTCAQPPQWHMQSREQLVEDNSRHYLTKGQYQEVIEDFCQSYTNTLELRHTLLQWAEMRLKNGWALTLWGMEALLENLQEFGTDCVTSMTKVVKQSLTRRWKGFFPYKEVCRPHGEKLLKLEEKEAREEERHNRYLPPHTKKCNYDAVDLSFLEE